MAKKTLAMSFCNPRGLLNLHSFLRLRSFLAAAMPLALSTGLSAASLMEAVKSGDATAVRALLKTGKEVNAGEADGTTALHWAVRANQADTVRLLLDAKANAKAANRYGVTPLSLAAMNGNAVIAKMLLKAGADPNTTSSEGETVLMTAARSGNPETVALLIEQGAEVNARENWYGETALMWAAAENHPEAAKILIDHGAQLNARSNVLEGVPKWREGVDGRSGPNHEALQSLLSTYPVGGLNALLFAARQGSVDAARVLIDAGAEKAMPDPDGISPLLESIINAHFDIAALLIEKGANVNQADRTGRTPLYAAADMRALQWVYNRPSPRISGAISSLDLMKMLLDKGADPNARLKSRPLSRGGVASNNANLQAGATPLMKTAVSSDLAAMRLLLYYGADPKLTTQLGTNALHIAAGLHWSDSGMAPVKNFGLGREADALEAVTLLLNCGLDVNSVNSLNETPLHGAATRGANDVVRLLVERGAKLDAKSKPRKSTAADAPPDAIEEGRTPLDEALASDPPRKSTAALLEQLMHDQASARLQ